MAVRRPSHRGGARAAPSCRRRRLLRWQSHRRRGSRLYNRASSRQRPTVAAGRGAPIAASAIRPPPRAWPYYVYLRRPRDRRARATIRGSRRVLRYGVLARPRRREATSARAAACYDYVAAAAQLLEVFSALAGDTTTLAARSHCPECETSTPSLARLLRAARRCSPCASTLGPHHAPSLAADLSCAAIAASVRGPISPRPRHDSATNRCETDRASRGPDWGPATAISREPCTSPAGRRHVFALTGPPSASCLVSRHRRRDDLARTAFHTSPPRRRSPVGVYWRRARRHATHARLVGHMLREEARSHRSHRRPVLLAPTRRLQRFFRSERAARTGPGLPVIGNHARCDGADHSKRSGLFALASWPLDRPSGAYWTARRRERPPVSRSTPTTAPTGSLLSRTRRARARRSRGRRVHHDGPFAAATTAATPSAARYSRPLEPPWTASRRHDHLYQRGSWRLATRQTGGGARRSTTSAAASRAAALLGSTTADPTRASTHYAFLTIARYALERCVRPPTATPLESACHPLVP